MRRASLAGSVFGAAVVVAVGIAATTPRARGAPASSASAYAKPSSSAKTSPPASSATTAPSATAPTKTLTSTDVPAELGADPSDADWKGAGSVDVSRGTMPAGCSARTRDGWVRIVCHESPGVGLVAGDGKLARLRSTYDDAGAMTSVADLGVRPGTSAIVTFIAAEKGTTTMSSVEGPTFQLGFREGATAPALFAYPLRSTR